MNLSQDRGSIIVDLLTKKVEIFYAWSQPDKEGDKIVRFCLQGGVLDDLPAEMGEDFSCRVAWAWYDTRIKFGTDWHVAADRYIAAHISCRTNEGRVIYPVKSSEFSTMRCSFPLFFTYAEIAKYLLDGEIPDERKKKEFA